MRWIWATVLLLTTVTAGLFGQEIEIKRTTGPIKIDGVMDEAAWFDADSAYNFQQYFP